MFNKITYLLTYFMAKLLLLNKSRVKHTKWQGGLTFLHLMVTLTLPYPDPNVTWSGLLTVSFTARVLFPWNSAKICRAVFV